MNLENSLTSETFICYELFLKFPGKYNLNSFNFKLGINWLKIFSHPTNINHTHNIHQIKDHYAHLALKHRLIKEFKGQESL